MPNSVFLGSVYGTFELRTEGLQTGLAAANAQLSGLQGSSAAANNALGSVQSAFTRTLLSVQAFSSQASTAFGGVASGIESFAGHFRIAGFAAAAAFGLMGSESVKMVVNVQRSTIALTAYTGSAEQAASITKELIDFAKSPRGVLFNRDELLQTATLLKGAGLETSKLTGFIQNMAPAVAASGGKFQDLGQILAKVVATGRLDAQTFDELAIRNVVLDHSLRGTAISADQLQAALLKAVPASILDQQAQTIEGRFIRLKTAFRELGNNLLGVTYGASQFGATFAPGSLGDAAIKAMMRLTDVMKDPAVTAGFTELGQSAIKGLNLVVDGLTLLLTHIDTVKAALVSLASAWAFAKGAQAAFTAVNAGSQILLVASGAQQATSAVSTLGTASQVAGTGLSAVGTAGEVAGAGISGTALVFAAVALAIVALVGVLVFLQIKFGIFDGLIASVQKFAATVPGLLQPVVAWFQNLGTLIAPAVNEFVNTIGTVFGGIVAQVGPALSGLGSAVGGAFDAIKGALSGIDFSKVASDIAGVVGGVLEFVGKMATIVGPVLGTVLSGIISVMSTVISTIGSVIARVIPIVAPLISQIGGVLGPAFTAFGQVITFVAGILSAILIPIFNALVAVINFLVPIIGGIIVVAFTVLVAVISAVVSVISFLVNGFIAIVTAIVGFLMPGLTLMWTIFTTVFNAISSVVMSVIGFIAPFIIAGVQMIVAVVGTVMNVLSAIWSAIWNTIEGVVTAVIDGIVGVVRGISRIVGIVGGAIGDAYNAVKNFVGKFLQVGKDIINGIVDGLRNAGKDVIHFIENLLGDAVAIAKKILHIGSPSRVFAEEVGMPIAQGIAQGIMDGASHVQNALDSVLATPTGFNTLNLSAVDTAAGRLASLPNQGLDNSGDAGSGEVNNSKSEINIYPKQLTQADMDMVINQANFEQGLSLGRS